MSVGMSDEDLGAHWQSLRLSMTRAEQRIDRIIEDSGVPAQWFAVLYLLLRAEDHRAPMSVLARELAMTSGGFTKLADRMARGGLIDRRGSLDDRRVVHAALTDDGRQLARTAAAVYQRALRESVLDVIGAESLVSAAATLAALGPAQSTDEPEEIVESVGNEHGPTRPDRRRRSR